ncbi:catalase-like [Agrilus planipennis]|uniref:Catalase n=1 Tax=Agrilus planipennis TaxID=224129 RepID=A0A1W4WEZ4_AGRPL|nr:catalase-like [Agrilus planipennis]
MPLLKVREPALNQLLEYAQRTNKPTGSATTTSGNPIVEKDASLTAGPRGVILFQNYDMVDELAHFDRERIPERVVHAKGAGAFGYFVVTNDITQYTAASVFSAINKRTSIAIRFSAVAGEMGYADSVRDVRGFAIKFYTEDGIWDLVGNNTPLFFVKDPVNFMSFIHVLKRNPVTHLRDPEQFWDYLTLRPESLHQTMIVYTDRGIPDGYRHMHGYGADTFSLLNDQGVLVYCKFHHFTDQGIKNLDPQDAIRIAGEDPDYFTRDLYNSIAAGNYPSWRMFIQVMTQKQALESPFDPFDVSKIWPHADYPLIPVGKFELTRNPDNYFADIEQLAFDPAHLIPGIEPSSDRFIQGRLFAYGDTQRYRLGTNYNQIPVNNNVRVRNFSRDGKFTLHSQNGAPIYHPNSFGGPEPDPRAKALSPEFPIVGNAVRYDNGNDDPYSQPRVLWVRVLDQGEKERMVENIVLGNGLMALRDASDFIQNRAIVNFTNVHPDFGRMVRDKLSAQLQFTAQL